MKSYEAMFLLDPAVTSDWDAARGEVQRLLDRAEARLIACEKWDERRLAYEIRGRKRGVYALTFFEADASKIAGLERDAQLSEGVLRLLVLQAGHLSEEEMKEIASRPAAKEVEGDRGGWRDGDGPPHRRRRDDSRRSYDDSDRRDRSGREPRRERYDRREGPAKAAVSESSKADQSDDSGEAEE